MNNLQTRKRIFEILNNLYVNKPKNKPLKSIAYALGIQPYSREIFELIELITNKNPYIDFPKADLAYINSIKFLDKENSVLGLYQPDNECIHIKSTLLLSLFDRPIGLCDTISTISHEQRHHQQHISEPSDLKFVKDIKKELLTENLSEEEINELIRFIEKNNLEKDQPFEKSSVYQFGAYLSNACEIDARKHEYESTILIMQHLINDELCSDKLKTHLKKALIIYKQKMSERFNTFDEYMEEFSELRKRLKHTFNKILKNSNEQLLEKKYFNILNRVITSISKDMTPEEKVQYIAWAVENNHLDLIHQISYDANEADKEAISKYLTSMIESQKISPENCLDLFRIYAIQFNNFEELQTKNTKLAIKMINNSQVGLIQNLIDHDLKESLDLNLLIKHFVPYAKNEIKFATPESFNLLQDIRNVLLSLIYSPVDYETSESLKPILSECYNKITQLLPKDARDYVGEVLKQIRSNQNQQNNNSI